jgi:hypothetical protein
MIKVVVEKSSDWIQVLGHSNTKIWEGPRVSALDLQYILNIVSRDGCEIYAVEDLANEL